MGTIEIEFVQLELFSRQLDRLGEPDIILSIEEALLKDPGSGVLLRGGLRKLRLPSAVRGVGKRGGYRVWHFFYRHAGTVYLLYLHDKRDGANIPPDIERALLSAVQALLKERQRKEV